MNIWGLQVNDEKVNICWKTMVTHLSELRNPLLGHDPQFGKCWIRWPDNQWVVHQSFWFSSFQFSSYGSLFTASKTHLNTTQVCFILYLHIWLSDEVSKGMIIIYCALSFSNWWCSAIVGEGLSEWLNKAMILKYFERMGNRTLPPAITPTITPQPLENVYPVSP